MLVMFCKVTAGQSAILLLALLSCWKQIFKHVSESGAFACLLLGDVIKIAFSSCACACARA